MNSCIFKNFKIEDKMLSFDAVVNFVGIVPKTGKQVEYNNEIFPFCATFSEPLEYDNTDIISMLECYIKQASLLKIFEKIEIELPREGRAFDIKTGNNFLFFNSYGLDSYSIYLIFRDELKEKMVELTWSTEQNLEYTKSMANACVHYRAPVIVCFKNMLESIDVLWNPCNSTYIKYLLYKKFNIGLTLYGDVTLCFYVPTDVAHIRQLNFGFYPSEFISLYIDMVLGSREMFNKMLFDNWSTKVIRKCADIKILTEHLGLKFENFIDMNQLHEFKKKISSTNFDCYWKAESVHLQEWLALTYFYHDEFIKTLQELFYDSEKEIVEEKIREAYRAYESKPHPIYNNRNYFKIPFKGFKQYMEYLPETFKGLEKIMYNKYKLLNLFSDDEGPEKLDVKNG